MVNSNLHAPILQWNKQNKDIIAESKNVGCYYCCTIFPATMVVDWCRSGEKGSPEDCAICPHCSIDAILPDTRVVLSIPFLRELRQSQFEG